MKLILRCFLLFLAGIVILISIYWLTKIITLPIKVYGGKLKFINSITKKPVKDAIIIVVYRQKGGGLAGSNLRNYEVLNLITDDSGIITIPPREFRETILLNHSYFDGIGCYVYHPFYFWRTTGFDGLKKLTEPKIVELEPMETILEIKDSLKIWNRFGSIIEMNGVKYLKYSKNLQFNKSIYYKYYNFLNLLDKKLTKDHKNGLKRSLEKIKKRVIK
jgi:hypothetical protein